MLEIITRWPVLQKVRYCGLKPLYLLVNIRFQILFHSPPGVLFTVPSRYYALSVTKEYLALGGGPPIFPQGFTCLVVLFGVRSLCISCTGLLPSLADLPISFYYTQSVVTLLGSFPFARRYLGNRGFFLFLGVLRCFSSPGLPSIHYGFMHGCMRFAHTGFPIRTSTDSRLFATPRCFSQLITSFFGSWCQGIHLMLFLT